MSEEKNALSKSLASLQQSEQFKELESMMSKFNIFDCLKLTRNEIRHSNFLAWLLNPNETHNFKDLFLKKFLIKVVDLIQITNDFYSIDMLQTLDLSNVEILREYKNIDLLIKDENNKFIVVIENKIDSFQHDNQLEKYKNYINEESSVKDFKKLYIYLSPRKEKIEEPYKYIDYNIISKCLKEILNEKSLKQDVKFAIENYNEIIERNIMDKDGIRILCREIYSQHRKAIDTICKYKDLREYMSNLLQEVIKENPKWTLLDSTKYWVRFIPRNSDKQSLHFAKKDWVNTENILVFEIHNEDGYIDLDMVVRLTSENQTSKRENLMKIIKEIEEFKDYKETTKKNDYDHIANSSLITKSEYNDILTKSTQEIKSTLKERINNLKYRNNNVLELFRNIADKFDNQ